MPHSDLPSDILSMGDISDPKLYATDRPEEIWSAMRKFRKPLHLSGVRDHWALTCYGDVETVYRNGQYFSSERGMQLGNEQRRADLSALAAAGKSLVATDDPLHIEMRKPMGPSFSHQAIRKLDRRVHEMARELVLKAATGDVVDFVEMVAAPLPAMLISDIIGVPERDRSYVMRLTQQAFSDTGDDPSAAQLAANAGLFEYCDSLIKSKHDDPGDDVASALAYARLRGNPMGQEVAVLNCHDLFAAGNETTRHASAAAALSMVTHPQQWARLRDGTADVDGATDEVLRLEAPLSHVMRIALEDFNVGEVTIPQGEFVTLWLRSANRDQKVFDRPDDLLFTRRPNRHLTFGLNSHFCLGALLARLELSSTIKALLEIVTHVELGGTPARLASNFIRGYKSMPLSMTPR